MELRIMQVTETLSEGLKRGFTVVVPAADIEDERTKRLDRARQDLRLPGFRPGKVPTDRGAAALRHRGDGRGAGGERQRRRPSRCSPTAACAPALQPKVDVTKLEDEQDLEFKVELELLPEIAMPDFAAHRS